MFKTIQTQPAMAGTTRKLLGAAMVLAAGTALAGPQPTEATDGVSFDSPAAGVTNITAPNNAIIDYASFNVGAGEAVNFIQPGASSRVLNRIHSSTPSQIDGTITANGIVYLVNPSGVTFGPDSVVDVAGLYAAAGSLSNNDFASGLDRFNDLNGAVTAKGIVRAETIAALIGREVVHTGAIHVPNGTAVLASGTSVLIGSPRGGVMLQLDVTPRTTDGGVIQDGTINAKQTSLMSGDMYALAITTSPLNSGPGDGGVTIEEADTDGDGDIDFDDINRAYDNYTGPVAPGANPGKTQALGDTDGDGDVDDTDIGNMYAMYTGPIVQPPTGPPVDPPVADEFNLSSADSVARLPEVPTEVNLTEADLSILRDQLGVSPRAIAARERIEKAQNRALYNDLSPALDRPVNDDGSISVANTRLDADVVREALELYRQQLAVEGVTPLERTSRMRSAVKETMISYTTHAAQGEGFDAERFVDYLAQANPTLLRDLAALEKLRQMTLRMGLSEREKQNSDRVIINRAKPDGLSFGQMKATLQAAVTMPPATPTAKNGNSESTAAR